VPRRQSDADILATAKKRYKLAEEAEREIRCEAKVDLEFAAGNQWDSYDRTQRNASGGSGQGGRRPCLVFNKLKGPLNMIANEARMNPPSIEVLPVDSTSDPETAKVLEGMIRHIQYVSKADQVYETSLEQSTKGSFSYFKVSTQYCGNKTFNQELRIEGVQNQFNVLTDPFAKQPDRSDMMWAFELEWYSREDYREEFGDTEIVQMNWFDGCQNPAPDWIATEGVLVARYWYVEIEVKTLVAIEWPDGKITNEYVDELPDELPPGMQYATGDDGKRIEREDHIRHIKMCRLNGVEILDKTDWKGQWIPVLVTLGEEMYIDNKRYLFSLIRFARDPQKLYNFYRSSEAETVMLGTKAPWIGVKGAFKDPRWATANIVPWAYLEYEPIDIAGDPAPPPQRQIAEPPIQALSIGAAQAADDIKATTSVFDASLGARSNETSGVAIRQRQSQTGLTNFHFIDNLNRAILQCGAILCDLIPKIYDTPREVRILGEDMKEEIVKVNQRFMDDRGQERCYDLTNGKYDVRLRIGPDFKTDQEKTETILTELVRAYPAIMQVAGDIVFDNLNFKGAEKIAERLRKALPPGMAEDVKAKPAELLVQQNQQMAQTIEQLTAILNKQNEEIKSSRIEAESKERIEIMKIESSDRQAALNASLKQEELRLKALELNEKLTSQENITLMRAELASVEAQIARMATGAAAEESIPPAAPEAPPPVPVGMEAGPMV
jgi:hypothetical protein